MILQYWNCVNSEYFSHVPGKVDLRRNSILSITKPLRQKKKQRGFTLEVKNPLLAKFNIHNITYNHINFLIAVINIRQR